MATLLIEREKTLAALDAALAQAGSGIGRMVLLVGEAGIGKTSVVEAFLQRHQSVRMLWGACEALFTPRPLGPLHDVAMQTEGQLGTLLAQGADRPQVFAAAFELLRAGPSPRVLVFEDAHWADEATLDFIKYLGRRLHLVSAVFIVTYRDDEVGPSHPLWSVLGDLPVRLVQRVRLQPLSGAGVAQLAQDAQLSTNQIAQLYEATGGNPFFVTEVLASEGGGVPETVRDAVLARVARLTPRARELTELASVVPARVEEWVLEPTAQALDECLGAGMLLHDGETIAFRHELARRAVEETLPTARAQALHARVLQALLVRAEPSVSTARLVHHAIQAADRDTVLAQAPRAAAEAAAQGAHREAAAHYRTALRFLGGADPQRRAELLEGLAYECYLTSAMEEAVRARVEALAIWRQLKRLEEVGRNLRWLSRQSWYLGRNADAETYADDAMRLLETLPAGKELAMAYSNRSQLYMLVENVEHARRWGERAIALARQLGNVEIESHALNNVGTAELQDEDEHGRELLKESLRLARAHQLDEHVARAYTNLVAHDVLAHDHVRASVTLSEGMSYCADRDLDSWGLYMQAWRARVRLNQGDWAGANDDATPVAVRTLLPTAIRLPALMVVAWLRVRHGDPGAQGVLDEARDLALPTGELQRIAPVAAARAEHAWLHGNLARCQEEARVGYLLAQTHRNPWQLGEMAYWVWRGGGMEDVPHAAAEPYARMMVGDWRAAASHWERLGSPYQRALALMDGDEAAQRTALASFEGLGARPAAELVRKRLAEAGARGLPRGPRAATRENPAGLTERQLEVLRLVAEGLHNGEIADRLSTSPKTVEHHVSAVLAKLGVRSRAEAIARAIGMSLIPTDARHHVVP